MAGVFYFWIMAGSDLTVNRLVKNRLAFLGLLSDTTYDQLIEDFGIEMMYLLQIPLGNKDQDDTWIEEETNYSVTERGLIADLVSCFMILRKVFVNIEGDGTTGGGASGSKYLKRAKAGEVEAEFALPKSDESSNLQMKAEQLLDGLKNAACQKASQLGFTLCVCDDCSLQIDLFNSNDNVKPFFVYVPNC